MRRRRPFLAGIAAGHATGIGAAFVASLLLHHHPDWTIGPDVTDIEPEMRRTASTAEELNAILRSDFKGRVIVPKDVSWEMSGFAWYDPIPLGDGIQLVGERGELGSRPLISAVAQRGVNEKGYALFRVMGNDVHVEGLHFRGPWQAEDHKKGVSSANPYVHGIEVTQDADYGLSGHRVIIYDNEFDQWSGGGVHVIGSQGSVSLDDWKPEWKHLNPEQADLVQIVGNYMHHNCMDGGGYGVVIGGGGYATIEGNVFDTNRHAVAGSGKAYSGYVARFNYVLQGGVKQANRWPVPFTDWKVIPAPDFYNQHFDMHGSYDGYGGYAGEYVRIELNTIRGEQKYGIYGFRNKRTAFTLRGRPNSGAYFRSNIVVHDNLDEAVALKMSKSSTGIGEDHLKFRFSASGNSFDTDYSTEIAAGDFDGDGHTDIFLANGTAWFYSRRGIGPWQYLRPSDKRTGELAFADIDNDGVTDVLWRDSNGTLSYVKGGWFGLTPITTTPVGINELRFGDFDGDGLTDIFYTLEGRWWIWYGSTRAWTEVGGSSFPLSSFLFGKFDDDDVPRTDIAAVTSLGWSYSKGATEPWAPFNEKLTPSFSRAAAADLDGSGKSDIIFFEEDRWRYSPNGRMPLEVVRNGEFAPLDDWVIGRFDGGTRDLAVTFGGDERLISWGLGFGNEHRIRSSQAMR
jgi:hypothetical protein